MHKFLDVQANNGEMEIFPNCTMRVEDNKTRINLGLGKVTVDYDF